MTEILINILERLKLLYPSLSINMWIKDDKAKLTVNDKTVAKFNPELIQQQLYKASPQDINNTVNYFSERIEKKYIAFVKRYGVRGRPCIILTEPQIQYAIENTNSCAEASRFLKVNDRTFKKWASKYGLYEGHKNSIAKGIVKGFFKPKISMDDIFANKYPNYGLHHLKRRLIYGKILEERCEICGYNDRRELDGHVALVIDWKDSNVKNLARENLRLICYNCAFNIRGKVHIKQTNAQERLYKASKQNDTENPEVYDDLFDKFNKK